MRIETAIRRLCLLSLTLGLVRAAAADYFVSTQGNDSNPGTAAQPFRTITRAYSAATAGTTITVLPGVYTDYQTGWGLHLNKNGTAASPITLRSQVRGQAIIDGQNISDRNQGIYLDGSYNIIDGFQIRGGPHGGIMVWGNYNQILNNDIHHNGNPASSSQLGQDGVYSGENSRNTVYRGNLIRDNGRTGSNLDHALYLCGDNEVVINNVLIRNAAYGLHIAGYTTVSNMKVYNNVMAHNGKSGIILWMPVNGVDIKNNIIYQNGKFGIDSYDAHGSGVVIDRNLVFGNSLGNYGLNRDGSDFTYTLGTTISSAPSFVNSTAAGFDARLSAGSPAINAALNLFSSFTTDIDGVTRPATGAWDLGAYKYGSADTTAPAVSLTAPLNNATISGLSVTVSANASDNVGVAGVQFKLNGANLGAEDTSAPYSVTLNTTTLLNGAHTLSAVARDAAGNQTTGTAVSVLINNLVNTPPIISSIASQTITIGSSTGPLSFTVADLETSANGLSVSGSSSNPTLLPNGGIIFGGSGSSRIVTVTPTAGQTGTATITVTVSDGSLTKSTSFGLTVNPLPTITLTSPTNGISYTAPATIGLAANVAANGNTISKVQFFQGATLLGEDTISPYNFTWSGVNAGSYSITARAVYGSTNVVASPTVGVAVSATPSSGLTLGIGSATVTAPFVISNGTISQPINTGVTAGGRAAYPFTISTAGSYVIVAQVNTPSESANSFFVNIDTEPSDPTMIWDIPLTSGLAERTVSWRGNGTFDNAEFAPKVFNLSAGMHTLIIRGREANTHFGTITITPITVLPTVTVTTSDANASRVGLDSGAFLISRNGSTAVPLTVNYSLTGTAINGVDYQTLTGSAIIPAGATSVALTVTPNSSPALVDAKTVRLLLTADSTYTVGTSSSAGVTIAGNSIPASLKVTPGKADLTWTSVTGKIYRVAYKTSLDDLQWADLSGNITATGASTSWSDPDGGRSAKRFYTVYVTN